MCVVGVRKARINEMLLHGVSVLLNVTGLLLNITGYFMGSHSASRRQINRTLLSDVMLKATSTGFWKVCHEVYLITFFQVSLKLVCTTQYSRTQFFFVCILRALKV